MIASTATRYSIFSAIIALFLMFTLWWLVLWALSPDDEIVRETVITKQPTVEHPTIKKPYDPYKEARQEARYSGIDARLTVGIIKSEQLLKRPKAFEDSCLLNKEQGECIQKLAERYKSLATYLGRKPTPSDLLLAHTFGENEAIRISRLAGTSNMSALGEEILKANPNIKGYKSVRNFRIWLSRAVYRNMY